jgi:hypothetical protein
MTNLQVQWYNKLVDEIVRRYINDVKQFDLFSFFNFYSFSEKKMNLYKYLMIHND